MKPSKIVYDWLIDLSWPGVVSHPTLRLRSGYDDRMWQTQGGFREGRHAQLDNRDEVISILISFVKATLC